jgi:diacylglycerol kinase (ATP)
MYRTLWSSPCATLIVNPAAGALLAAGAGDPPLDLRMMKIAAWVSCYGGFETVVKYTTPEPGSATQLAREAATKSALVIACGGDGTIHEVVQGLATHHVMLAVVPMGTANALARHLGIPMDPHEAIKTLFGSFRNYRIPLGKIETAAGCRYFLLMAGCGPDGALVQSLSPEEKRCFGRRAYYAHAARLFFTRRWPAFQVDYREGNQWFRLKAVGMMAARVPDLGGPFSGLTAGASLTSTKLQAHILRPPAQLSFPAWFGLSRAHLPNPFLKTIEADEVRCSPIGERPVYAQADAEPLGPLPFTLSIVPNVLTLMMPR